MLDPHVNFHDRIPVEYLEDGRHSARGLSVALILAPLFVLVYIVGLWLLGVVTR
jgi:hypothetical protein